MLTIIGNILGIVKEWLGYNNKKLELNNTVDMRKNKVAVTESVAVDKLNKAIQNKDNDEIRKTLS